MEFNRIADLKRLQFIIDTLKKNLPAQSVVLDVGCGNGVISRNLGRCGYNVFGIDVSEKAILKAKELNEFPNVNFDVISAEQLVADGNKYNAIICSEVLEHLNKPEDLLKTLYRSLTDDGVLIVTVPNGMGPRELFVTKPVIRLQKQDKFIWHTILKIKKLFGYTGITVQSSASDLTHIQFFTKTALQNLAKENNFQIIKFGKTNFVEDVFPFSIFSKRIKLLQKIDCAVAEVLPYSFTGGFVTVWKKNRN